MRTPWLLASIFFHSAAVAVAQVRESERALERAEALHEEGEEQLEFAEAELQRVQRLAQTGIEGARARQLAERDRDASRARLASLQAGVARALLVAP